MKKNVEMFTHWIFQCMDAPQVGGRNSDSNLFLQFTTGGVKERFTMFNISCRNVELAMTPGR